MAGWVLQLFGRSRLFLLEVEKRLEIGVALQIPENAVQNRVAINRLSVTLVQAEKKLLLRSSSSFLLCAQSSSINFCELMISDADDF